MEKKEIFAQIWHQLPHIPAICTCKNLASDHVSDFRHSKISHLLKDCMVKRFADYPHRLMDVVPVLDDILSYSWFVLRQVWQGTFPQELESGPVLSTKHLLNLRNCLQLNSFEKITHHGVQVVRV